MSFIKKITFVLILMSFAFAAQGFSQPEKDKKKEKKVNFGYSVNPPSKKTKKADDKQVEIADKTNVSKTNEGVKTTKVKAVVESKNGVGTTQIISTESTDQNPKVEEEAGNSGNDTESVSIASKTRAIAEKADREKLLPTEYYKVGVGDVLYINLQDTSAKYYTVLIDGTIDYPLAGKLVSVVDLTTEEIEELLREKITLYENPQVVVKVKEYTSHKFKVAGLARKGTHYLQREAMPLVVVKTMVGVQSDADSVIIERVGKEPKTIQLNSDDANAFLIKPNDKLTFEKSIFADVESTDDPSSRYYFLGEKICDGGKKKFHNGITLVQAVFDACGGLNNKLKEISIIRKTKSGRFISKKYDFKKILKGDEEDPKLLPDDLIDAAK